MIKNEVLEQDLHFAAGDMAAAADACGGLVAGIPTGFDAMEEDHQLVDEMDSLLDVTDASIFYNDFPPLPDFHCMSSSSSSSPSTPAVSKPLAATSSSSSAASSSPAVSWAMMRSDHTDEQWANNFRQFRNGGSDVKAPPSAALSSTASMEIPPPTDHDCLGDVGVTESFGYMDLIDCNEIWDPSSIFQSENPHECLEDQQAAASAPPPPMEEENGFASFLQGNSELAAIFFEWLKQNRDYISAEDMRSIKLKRSTIESATKRLGTNKEGKKQLLKLILEWVEQHQLQKKQVLDPNPNPNPNPNFAYSPVVPPDPNTCFSTSPWMHTPHVSEVAAMPPPVYTTPPMAGYVVGDPYANPLPVMPMAHQVVNGIIPYPHSAEYPVMDHAQSWPMSPLMPMAQPQFSPYPDNGNIINHHPHQSRYGNPYQVYDPDGETFLRLGSSATKEARKKRMARQRRLYSHHHRHSSNSNNNQNQMSDPHGVGDDDGGSPGNWNYWLAGAGSSDPMGENVPLGDGPQPLSGDRAAMQAQKQAALDRRQEQGWKTEKNLKFLLQKVLKQSDVGNLGRIVLPKKEAESHLPELESRDGITIAMEDIGTSRVWNMRYRFWPNNKSRMYLLENTGDFVRANGLQEGDFIVIYSDTKCGKYMIRGVKVRQPGTKPECKKPARRNTRNLSLAGSNTSSLAPIKQAVR
ncbi:B3 domain-containing transcription factor [Orobanche hederae]